MEGNTLRLAVVAILLLGSVYSLRSTKANNWSLKGIRELNCFKCKCLGTPVNELGAAGISGILTQGVYTTMASKMSYMHCAYRARGTKITSNEDADQMCRYNGFDQDSSVVYSIGYGINVTKTISLKRGSVISEFNKEQNLDPSEMSPSDSKMYIGMTSPAKLYVVWTDGISTLLLTVCNWDGQTAWFVLSTKKTLSKRIKSIVLGKIVDLGFNPSNAYIPDYKNCKFNV